MLPQFAVRKRRAYNSAVDNSALDNSAVGQLGTRQLGSEDNSALDNSAIADGIHLSVSTQKGQKSFICLAMSAITVERNLQTTIQFF
uniref:Uncharacterized protein n=1 Tax=Globodera rostochiensis TaxID=31243 RepID=A0A914H6S2_GLORO